MKLAFMRRRLLVAPLALLAVAGTALAAVSTLAGGNNPAHGGTADNPAATSVATVRERRLSSQTQASGTLGYADPSAVVNLGGAGAGENTGATATSGGQAAVYTMLPQAGSTILRGHRLYAVNAQPVLLLYGAIPAWRAFQAGMSAGRDVAELNANLRALGYGDPTGDTFSAATAQAVRNLQAAHGLPQTGALPLGAVVFKTGPVRVASVEATLGAPAQAGPVLDITSTRHRVAVQLDPSEQASVKVGDRVTVALPDQRTTAGVITKIGTVAQASGSASATGSTSSSASGSGSPTIEVDVRLLHEEAAGALDQAPVQVAITTASAKRALVVPVDALRALAGGGYAVETIDPAGVHHPVPVRLGLFDDADGLVQVSGPGLHTGQHVVVPTT